MTGREPLAGHRLRIKKNGPYWAIYRGEFMLSHFYRDWRMAMRYVDWLSVGRRS